MDYQFYDAYQFFYNLCLSKSKPKLQYNRTAFENAPFSFRCRFGGGSTVPVCSFSQFDLCDALHTAIAPFGLCTVRTCTQASRRTQTSNTTSQPASQPKVQVHRLLWIQRRRIEHTSVTTLDHWCQCLYQYCNVAFGRINPIVFILYAFWWSILLCWNSHCHLWILKSKSTCAIKWITLCFAASFSVCVYDFHVILC